MRWEALALALVLVTAGCLTGGSDGSDGPVRKASADVGDSTGGLEGTVTDQAIQAVEGALVRVEELDRTTRTESDGSFAFSNLEPGTYRVTVNASGFLSDRETVTVTAGEVTTIEYVLSRVSKAEPFTQTLELKGFFECGFGAGYDLSPAPPPANMSGGIISWSTCGTINSQVGENATNDRFDHRFTLEAPLTELVVETTWEPGAGSLSDMLWVDLVPQGHHCGNITTCEWSLLDHWGESPLVGEVNESRLEAEQDYFDRRCRNGVDEFCGYNFADDGWPLWMRTWARWECQPAGPQACVLLQQPFTHIATAFYNQPAPDGYSSLES